MIGSSPHHTGYAHWRAAPRRLARKLTVELIGTFFLVTTVCLASHPGSGAAALTPLAAGAVLMVMIFAGGHVSGGHFNPAVSIAVLVRGSLGRGEFLGYVIAQCLGAVLAALFARAVVGGVATPADVSGVWKLFAVEGVFTFALAYVMLNVATSPATEGNSFYGLAIGFTVVGGGFAAASISGAAFNPAVALGASVAGTFTWGHLWAYVVAALLGGVCAAAVFLFLEEPSRRRP
jgi:aquaporin Z